MARHLVTGGCGFLGSALVRRLVAEGHQVVVLDDLSRGHAGRRIDGVEYISADVRALPGPDGNACVHWITASRRRPISTVWHLAAINGTKNFYEHPDRVLDVQIRGTLNVLDACRVNGVEDLVLFSSSEVYADATDIPTLETVACTVPDVTNPRFSYGGGKIAAELLCWYAQHIRKLTVVRPHNVYGPDMGEDHVIPELIRRLDATREHGTIEVANPEHTRAFCYVDDFIDGAITAWKKNAGGRDIFHIGTETEIEIGRLALLLSEVMGTKRLAVEARPGPEGSPRRRCPDTRKIRELGWEPKVPLGEGLRRTVNWYLSEGRP